MQDSLGERPREPGVHATPAVQYAPLGPQDAGGRLGVRAILCRRAVQPAPVLRQAQDAPFDKLRVLVLAA